MPIIVDVQYASEHAGLPDGNTLQGWVAAALDGLRRDAELTVRIVDMQEGTELNERWHGGKGPTNVLSFPAGHDPAILPELLGDVVICAPLVASEAGSLGRQIEAHWAHLVIHGVLHLLGHDHQEDADAEIMESLETEKLQSLGYGNPYL